ncbi:DUF4336 domain-containing protein [Shewanella algae]
MPNHRLNPFGDNIWIVAGKTVPFFGLPYTTRMTVVRLDDGALWLHSPIALSDGLLEEVKALGEVSYLLAPNSLHHLFVKDWQQAFPNALSYATEELTKKRRDLHFDQLLLGELAGSQHNAKAPWLDELDFCLFQGSPVMQEAVFFHRHSRTLILTDLIENFQPECFKAWQRPLARISGILAPNGKTPLDWRLSFSFSKPQARKALATILGWQAEKLIIAHGECQSRDADRFIRRSFSWLGNLDH